MKILRLKLDGFGRFSDGISVEFDPSRVSVILGSNESGKSTLAAAIEALIFGLDKARLARYRPWRVGAPYRGQIILATATEHLRIARDFEANRVRFSSVVKGKEEILYQGSANPQGKDRTYFRLLSQRIGFSDGEIFRNTTFVPQSAIEATIDEEIRRLLTGSGRGDYVLARRALEEEYFSLTKENPWGRAKTNERTLESLSQRVDTLRDQLEKAEEIVSESAKVRQEIASLESELLRARREQAALEQTLANFQRYQEAKERAAMHHRRLDHLGEQRERLRGLKKKLSERQGQLRQVFSADVEDPRVRTLISQLGNTVEERNSLIARMDEMMDSSPKEISKGLLAGGIASLAVGLISGIGLAAAGRAIPAASAGGLLGLTGLTLLILALTRRTPVVVRPESEEIRSRLNERDLEIGELVSQVFDDGGPFNPIDFSSRYREYRTLDQEIQAFQSAIEVLGDEDQMEAQYRTAVNEAAMANQEVDSLAQSAPYLKELSSEEGAHRLERLRQDITEMPQILEGIEQRLRAKERDAAALQSLASDPEVMREEIEYLEDRIEVLELRKDALRMAIEHLTRAVDSFRSVIREQIEESTSELFRTVTGGQYRRIDLDSDFRPRPVPTDRNSPVPVEVISHGAQDQLHLALRLGVATELSGRVSPPPFILDDPFVNFDEERLTRVRILLKAANSKNQVILMSHSQVYRDWGKVVIDLNAS